MFITFEGGEGCGKSTQIKLLTEYLQNQGNEVVLTREPGGTVIAEKIRQILLNPEHKTMHSRCELLLYAASRAQHVEELIKPSLQAGKVVISDRFFDSTTAYQKFARGLDMDLVQSLIEVAVQGVVPELTLLLDIDVETGIKRALGVTDQHETRFEEETLEFHQRVRQGFLQIAKDEPDRIKVINASDSIEQVFVDIKTVVDEFMGLANVTLFENSTENIYEF